MSSRIEYEYEYEMHREHSAPERQLDVLRGAVAHQLELAIRWDERDTVLALEARQAHALMELAVVDRDASARPRAARAGATPHHNITPVRIMYKLSTVLVYKQEWKEYDFDSRVRSPKDER